MAVTDIKRGDDDTSPGSLEQVSSHPNGPTRANKAVGKTNSNRHNTETHTVPRSSHSEKATLVGPPAKLELSLKSKTASLKTRRLPVDILLRPSINDSTTVLSDEVADEKNKQESGPKNLIQTFCLRPGLNIRTQLMLAFGSINAITLSIVVLVCIFVAIFAGESIKDTNTSSFQLLERQSQVRSAQYVARSFDQMLIPYDEVDILREAIWDRFQGYPDTSDENVPFVDMETQTRQYPVIGNPVPLEWDLFPNVDNENYEEHFQERMYWRRHLDKVSTLGAGFMMQGTCDPAITDPNDPTYWPFCSDANNDISTGGIVQPTANTEHIYRKSSDLVPLLKALFESKQEMRDIGIFFANNGAGASLTYPQQLWNSSWSYVSAGCDWMNQPNPYESSRPIGSQEMIDRCHVSGTVVKGRSYNPLERAWCARQAIEPERLIVSADMDEFNGRESWLLTVGKAVYDRLTREFIGCIGIGISLVEIQEALNLAGQITDYSETSLILNDERGTVIASSNERLASLNLPVIETDLGLATETHQELYNLVDFDSPWDPEEASNRYASFEATDGTYLIAAYPFPPIPEKYESWYRPLGFVIMSTSIDELFSTVQEANGEVDDQIRDVVVFSVLSGAIGLVVTTIVILGMANVLTSPLTAMNNIANDIVINFGDPTKESKIEGSKRSKLSGVHCSPRTELDDVVEMFNKIVSTFSGKMMAKSEKGRYHETRNHFQLQDSFASLYMNRNRADFKYTIEPPLKLGTASASENNENEDFRFYGSNLRADIHALEKDTSVDKKIVKDKSISPLFIWIVGLIVTPLLLANVAITGVVMSTVARKFTSSVQTTKDFYVDVQRRALLVHARFRANYVSSLTRKSTRDAYIVTRYSSWLLFEGLERAEIFPKIRGDLEECKFMYGNVTECPYFQENFVCDCAWNTFDGSQTCTQYPDGSRNLQIPSWLYESAPLLPNGERNSTLYPNSFFSPDTTQYHSNPFQVPGWEQGSNASGYETAYDRLRSISALPLAQVIYNYDRADGNLIELFIGFDADGMVFGYYGCNLGIHFSSPSYSVTKEDSLKRPEICPEGKFGYDPRCRGWYDKGRELALKEQKYLHVTAPYQFALTTDFVSAAQTATTPVMQGDEYVGQVLVDFFADPIYDELDNQTFLSPEGFPVLIATESSDDADTVIAPGFLRDRTATQIAQHLLPFDYKCDEMKCKENLAEFNLIRDQMKRGDLANVALSRSRNDGTQETLYLAFAPVEVKSFRPVDSSDFTRGVEVSNYLVYSLGLAEPESSILQSFSPIEQTKEKQIRIGIAAFSILTLLATLVVLYVSRHVAKSISEPMTYFFELLHSMDSDKVFKKKPDTKYVNTSKEVAVLSDTLEMLYTLFQSANAAYYSGELELAHSILLDGLRLFTRLGNDKAIGIANNNIGNVVFALHQHMRLTASFTVAGLSRQSLVENGIGYYHEAIRLGEAAYDEFYNAQGWSPVCLEFTHHLANRYFNRGLFLLTVKDDHDNSIELEELGKRDLGIAHDMDEEMVSYGDDMGWEAAQRAENIFETKLLRARGYNMLLEQGYEDEWGVHEVLSDAFDVLKQARRQVKHPLFETMSYAGRLQTLETELVKYYRTIADVPSAATIAIRMLMEDEIIFLESQSEAMEALIEYLNLDPDLDDATRKKTQTTLRKYIRDVENVAEDHNSMIDSSMSCDLDSLFSRQSMISSLRYSSMSSSRRRSSIQTWSLKQSAGRFVTMENF